MEPVPPARRVVYDRLHARLAEANATLTAGRAEQAHALVDRLVAEVETEGFAGLAARARWLRSHARLELRRQDEAVTDASSAVVYAVRARDDELLASASLSLATALGQTSAATDEALRWLEVCAASAARPGGGSVREGRIAASRVQILLFGERISEAERAARDALAALPEGDSARFTILSVLGSALQRLSRPDEAIATHREAIAFVERVRGAEHPSVASALSNLAQSLQSVGRGKEAFSLIQRALAIRVSAYGEDSPAVADSYRILADAYIDAGDLPAARKEYEHALAIHRAHGDEAGQVFTLGNLAIVLNGLGDVPAARDLLLEALPMAAHRFGPTSRRVAEISVNLSGHLLELGETGEAAAYAEKALALSERLGAESPLTSGACINLAQIYGRQRRTEEALALLERAAGINAATLPPNAPEHAHVLLSRAMVLRDAGRLEQAAEAGTRAAESMERAGGPKHHETIEAQYLAGQDLLASGSTERARDLLERALEATDSTTVAPKLVAGIRWALAQALWPERGQRARAWELAGAAHDEMRALGDARAEEIEAWLASRRGVAPTRAERHVGDPPYTRRRPWPGGAADAALAWW
jgi:tetratricopeptide (TPR) repeat protein